MKSQRDEVINSVSLRPYLIIDASTRQAVPESAFNEDAAALTRYAQAWANDTLEDEDRLLALGNALSKLGKLPSNPAETARQVGFEIDRFALPLGALAASRINKIAGSLLVMSYLGWANSLVETKGLPRAGARIMLGSVDKQCAVLVASDDCLALTVKLWQHEYELYFAIPSYVQARSVNKWALPTIRPMNKHDMSQGFQFDYAYLERVAVPRELGSTAGIDLGFVKPFQAVVLNPEGLKIAQYEACGRIKAAWEKLDRIKQHRAHVLAKLDRVKALGSPEEQLQVLRTEAGRLRGKLTRMKATLAQQQAAQLLTKIARHDVNLVRMEYLSWVTGARYGSKWNHAAQQAAVVHRATRAGVRTERVNPAYTSSKCADCGNNLMFRANRNVYCSTCDKETDRDLNAGIAVARDVNKNGYSHGKKRAAGVGCSESRLAPIVRPHTSTRNNRTIQPLDEQVRVT
jgi:hypothetical protein